MRRLILFSFALSGCLWGCGGAEKKGPKVISQEDYETSTFSVEAGNGQVEGLLGNVTQDELERAFSDNRSAMLRCYENAVEDLEEIEGSLRFQAEVASDGAVQSAFIMESSLGSVDTETCMLGVLKRMTFNRVPGGVAVIYYPLELVAPYDHPPFVEWPDEKLSTVVDEHRAEIDSCLGGQSGVHLTLYIGMGGVVLSAGGAAETLDAYEAAACAAQAVRAWRFEDPKNRLVKASLDF